MTSEDGTPPLEQRIAQRESGLEQLGLADRIAAVNEIAKLKAELEALEDGPAEESESSIAEESPQAYRAATPPARRGRMPFIVCFLQQWAPGRGTTCTFCTTPFAADEIYLRGELYTTESRRWTWVSLHEACVLQHATLREYFARSRGDDFHAWFREQEQQRQRRRPEP